jgi:alkylation response protein AidB-like acyl-CoA dehydrogenase
VRGACGWTRCRGVTRCMSCTRRTCILSAPRARPPPQHAPLNTQRARVHNARPLAPRCHQPTRPPPPIPNRQIFPKDVMREAAALGFGGLYVPEEYGGSGLGRLDGAAVFEGLAYGDISTAAYLTIHNMVRARAWARARGAWCAGALCTLAHLHTCARVHALPRGCVAGARGLTPPTPGTTRHTNRWRT